MKYINVCPSCLNKTRDIGQEIPSDFIIEEVLDPKLTCETCAGGSVPAIPAAELGLPSRTSGEIYEDVHSRYASQPDHAEWAFKHGIKNLVKKTLNQASKKW